MSQYKAALIGLGNIAWEFGVDDVGSSLSHAAAYKANKKTELIAGFSVDAGEVEKFEDKSQLSGFTSLGEMLDDMQLDIVSICSPTQFHGEHLSACLDHGIPMIWLEKPPASSFEELTRLEGLHKKLNPEAKVLVNYQRRYTQSYENLKALLHNKYFGELISIEIRYSKGIIVNGSHMLDMIFYLVDDEKYELLWVENDIETQNPSAMLRLNNGIPIHIIGENTNYHNIDVVVTCEEGRFSILHGGMTARVEEKIEHELFPGFFRLKEIESDLIGQGGFEFSFDRALSDLIDSYEGKRSPVSTLATSHLSMKLLQKIQAKSRL